MAFVFLMEISVVDRILSCCMFSNVLTPTSPYKKYKFL
jgi:hypothetical protein